MYLNGFMQVFGGGMLGVVLMELVRVAAYKNTGRLSEKYKEPMYWIATGALLLVSGSVAAFSGGVEHVPVLTAIQLGINAPAIFVGYSSASSAARRTKKAQVPSTPGESGFMDFGQEPAKEQTKYENLFDLMAW